MRVAFVVNDAEEIVATQTTAMLIEAATRLGHDVWVAGVESVAARSDMGISITGRRLVADDAVDSERLMSSLRDGKRASMELRGGDAVMIRTNPGRDPPRAVAHRVLLTLLGGARRHGVRVINDPDGLLRCADKAFLLQLPEDLVPRTLVTADAERARLFARELGRTCVVKPVSGSRGGGVFMLEPDGANFGSAVDVLLSRGPVMVQEFLPEAADGDTRLVLLDGVPLTAGGRIAAVRRIPQGGDFRSNVHAGGRTAPSDETPAIRRIASAVGPVMRREGIRLCGVDIVSDRIIELNVFSTGGLYAAERYTGAAFAHELIERLLESPGKSRPPGDQGDGNDARLDKPSVLPVSG